MSGESRPQARGAGRTSVAPQKASMALFVCCGHCLLGWSVPDAMVTVLTCWRVAEHTCWKAGSAFDRYPRKMEVSLYEEEEEDDDDDDDLSTFIVRPTVMYERAPPTIDPVKRARSSRAPLPVHRAAPYSRKPPKHKAGRRRATKPLPPAMPPAIDLSSLLEALSDTSVDDDYVSTDEADADYFETLPDGTMRMKAGRKKIDITKLTDDHLRKLGIDPKNMTKEQIAKILKVRICQMLRSCYLFVRKTKQYWLLNGHLIYILIADGGTFGTFPEHLQL